MGSFVQHNIVAMNANRNLNVTTASQAKSTEKLSTGYKINRAADDAAGLSISEKMRRQIKGLTQASSNAQDGISSVQTAEGALTEVHDMLQRMDQLATKAATGTMSVDDRQNVQDEIDALLTEIDRVSETTKFNEIYLLKGDPTNPKQKVTQYLSAKDAGFDGYISRVGNGSTCTLKLNTSVSKLVADANTAKSGSGAKLTIGGVDYNVYKSAGLASKAKLEGVNNAISVGSAVSKMKAELKIANDIGQTAAACSVTANGTSSFTIKMAKIEVTRALSFDLHVGADADMTNKIGVDLKAMNTTQLGLKGLNLVGKYDSAKKLYEDDHGARATYAIDSIEDAIKTVSAQRSALGAVQNRLEHTIKNLDNINENTTSSESQIRDTDMATEMVNYSKNNILAQAGQSMLAQANQSNQGVLSLLG